MDSYVKIRHGFYRLHFFTKMVQFPQFLTKSNNPNTHFRAFFIKNQPSLASILFLDGESEKIGLMKIC
jgi:hypothetical protein